MNGFMYSGDEMEINKVLKMNQDTSKELLNDSDALYGRNQADINIETSLELLRSLGKDKDIEEMHRNIAKDMENKKYEYHPVKESWESIVEQANIYEPNPVAIEDIMTEGEIQNAFQELDDINKKFSYKTSIINKSDLSFLTIATALQVIKALCIPYIEQKFDYGNSFDASQRLDHNDKSIEREHRKANDGFRDRNLKKHKAGYWINLLYQTPPYDITTGSKQLGINMGGKYHRMYTLGHDPILGWLFGTANILTDCITFNNFQTNRISRIDSSTQKKRMVITPEIVPVGLMFKECYDLVREDFLNLPAAIYAQAQHFKSDEFTKLGLPVPLLSSINEEFASKLYSENYDALCFSRDTKMVGASFVVSKLIDMIISLVHGLFRKESEEKDLYEVRTRKILLISNSLASTSTIINASITNNFKKLDIGSLLNTISRLFTDVRFITKIKQEFINYEISNRIQEEIDEIEALFRSFDEHGNGSKQ